MVESKFTFRFEDKTGKVILFQNGRIMCILATEDLMNLEGICRDACFGWVEHFKKKFPQKMKDPEKNIIGG
jgi:hypothetical protein